MAKYLISQIPQVGDSAAPCRPLRSSDLPTHGYQSNEQSSDKAPHSKMGRKYASVFVNLSTKSKAADFRLAPWAASLPRIAIES